MEREGFVSLWIGTTNSEDLLDEYTELIYSDEGEWLPSSFLVDFNIDMDEFDEDYLEKVCYKNGVSTLKKLITGCSYQDVVIPRFINMFGNDLSKKVNLAILLYNFNYEGNIKDINHDKLSFQYIGTIQYR